VLLGRTSELARIDALLDGARRSRGGTLVLVGEAGTGKTALLEHARERADGMLVVSVSGIEAEAELPFAGLSVLLGPLVDGLDRLWSPQRTALAGALGLGLSPPSAPFATYAALLALLAQEAERRALVVLVDDAHWLDRASAEALASCARRVGLERIAQLFAARENGPASLALGGLVRLRLAGLDRGAAAALLRRAAGAEVSGEVAERVRLATGGNPLALGEIGRSLTTAQLAGSEPLPAALPIGRDLEAALRRRIAALPAATQTALVLAAANDSSDLRELVRALRTLSLNVSALAPGETAGIVTIVADTLQFSHPLLRSAAYLGAPSARRRQAHAALAAGLEAGGDRVRRAWHLAQATVEPDEAIAAEIETVAREASARAAPAAGGRALAAAARLTPPGVVRTARLLAGAEELYVAGISASALGLLDEALKEADSPIERADIQRLRARVMASAGPLAPVRELLTSEAIRVESHEPARAAAMRLDAALYTVMTGDVPEALQLAERAYPLVHAGGGPEALIASVVLASARILAGDARRAEPLLRDAAPLVATAELSPFGYVGAMIAVADTWMERYAESRRILVQIIARARADSALVTLPFALAWLADADLHLGRWTSALAEASEAVSLGEEVGRPGELVNALVVLAAVQVRRGDGADARVTIERAEAIAGQIGAHWMQTHARASLGLLERAEGRLDEAIAALRSAGRLAREGGLEEPAAVPWAQELAEAYARRGRNSGAGAALELLERQADRTGRRLARAGAARCRGLIAGDAEFEGHFRSALAWHDGVADPFERARTELCFGERLRRARRRRESREWLHRARDTFDRLGAAAWAEHARRELAASGERARRRTPDTADELTAKELQVALVVADGATNREAAAALFVTPKTVETHLHSIYRKLGVRSRVELARRLERSPK
jgi:DNA-binding CsgD family transcriptional regulator